MAVKEDGGVGCEEGVTEEAATLKPCCMEGAYSSESFTSSRGPPALLSTSDGADEGQETMAVLLTLLAAAVAGAEAPNEAFTRFWTVSPTIAALDDVRRPWKAVAFVRAEAMST